MIISQMENQCLRVCKSFAQKHTARSSRTWYSLDFEARVVLSCYRREGKDISFQTIVLFGLWEQSPRESLPARRHALTQLILRACRNIYLLFVLGNPGNVGSIIKHFILLNPFCAAGRRQIGKLNWGQKPRRRRCLQKPWKCYWSTAKLFIATQILTWVLSCKCL